MFTQNVAPVIIKKINLRPQYTRAEPVSGDHAFFPLLSFHKTSARLGWKPLCHSLLPHVCLQMGQTVLLLGAYPEYSFCHRNMRTQNEWMAQHYLYMKRSKAYKLQALSINRANPGSWKGSSENCNSTSRNSRKWGENRSKDGKKPLQLFNLHELLFKVHQARASWQVPVMSVKEQARFDNCREAHGKSWGKTSPPKATHSHKQVPSTWHTVYICFHTNTQPQSCIQKFVYSSYWVRLPKMQYLNTFQSELLCPSLCFCRDV